MLTCNVKVVSGGPERLTCSLETKDTRRISKRNWIVRTHGVHVVSGGHENFVLRERKTKSNHMDVCCDDLTTSRHDCTSPCERDTVGTQSTRGTQAGQERDTRGTEEGQRRDRGMDVRVREGHSTCGEDWTYWRRPPRRRYKSGDDSACRDDWTS